MFRYAPFAVALIGCAPVTGGTAPPTEIPELTNQFGCSDMWMFAVTADATASVQFVDSGAVAAAYAGTTHVALAAEDPSIQLTFEQGSSLDDEGCTDVVEYEDGEPVVRVDVSWTPVSGDVTLDVTPTSATFGECNSSADAALALDQVVFESPDGDQLTLDHLDVAAVVGVCPG